MYIGARIEVSNVFWLSSCKRHFNSRKNITYLSDILYRQISALIIPGVQYVTQFRQRSAKHSPTRLLYRNNRSIQSERGGSLRSEDNEESSVTRKST